MMLFGGAPSVERVMDILFEDREEQDRRGLAAELRKEHLADLKTLASPHGVMPDTIHVTVRPVLRDSPVGDAMLASGMYTVDKKDAMGVPTWHSAHHKHTLCINRRNLCWHIANQRGDTIAESTSNRTYTTISPPHELDWRVACSTKCPASMTLRGEDSMSLGAALRFTGRLEQTHKIFRMRHQAMFATADRATMSEMVCRINCFFSSVGRVLRLNLMAKRSGAFLKFIRKMQATFRQKIAQRNAMFQEVLEAWRADDAQRHTQLRTWTRRMLNSKTELDEELTRRVVHISVPDIQKKAAIVHTYRRRVTHAATKKASQVEMVSHNFSMRCPKSTQHTLNEIRYVLTQLEQTWRDARLQCVLASHGDAAAAKAVNALLPKTEAGSLSDADGVWSLTFLDWIPQAVQDEATKAAAAMAAECEVRTPPPQSFSMKRSSFVGVPRRSRSIGPSTLTRRGTGRSLGSSVSIARDNRNKPLARGKTEARMRSRSAAAAIETRMSRRQSRTVLRSPSVASTRTRPSTHDWSDSEDDSRSDASHHRASTTASTPPPVGREESLMTETFQSPPETASMRCRHLSPEAVAAQPSLPRTPMTQLRPGGSFNGSTPSASGLRTPRAHPPSPPPAPPAPVPASCSDGVTEIMLETPRFSSSGNLRGSPRLSRPHSPGGSGKQGPLSPVVRLLRDEQQAPARRESASALEAAPGPLLGSPRLPQPPRRDSMKGGPSSPRYESRARPSVFKDLTVGLTSTPLRVPPEGLGPPSPLPAAPRTPMSQVGSPRGLGSPQVGSPRGLGSPQAGSPRGLGSPQAGSPRGLGSPHALKTPPAARRMAKAATPKARLPTLQPTLLDLQPEQRRLSASQTAPQGEARGKNAAARHRSQSTGPSDFTAVPALPSAASPKALKPRNLMPLNTSGGVRIIPPPSFLVAERAPLAPLPGGE